MPTVELNLADILRGGAAPRSAEASRPLPEAQIMGLRELLNDERAPNTFKVGDLVTPKERAPYVLAGQPHIVIEVLYPPIRPSNDSSLPDCGAPHDLRVGVIDRAGDKSVYLMRSIYLEAYTGQGAEEAKPAGEWIEWGGGMIPVAGNPRVEVEFRDGTHGTHHALQWQWEWEPGGHPADIVRYRVLS